MAILRDISLLWSLVHALVLFFFLFESRYPRRKTLIITVATMVPLGIVNMILFALLGIDGYGTLMLLTLSLPSCLIFWVLAKHRDGRFFFTFCMVDTIVLEIIYITNLLNHYLTPDSYLVMFIVRMVIYPLIELWAYKQLRPIFLGVQKHIKKGWGVFAVIGALFYLAITLLMTHPTSIVERPENIPVLIILFFLMPVIYIHIIVTLRRQQNAYEAEEQEELLQVQISSFTSRMAELVAADEKFRVERHNFRHKLKTIAGLIKKEQYEECLKLLSEFEEALDRTKVKHYCQHAVLDATLSSYLAKAQAKNISVDMGFAFPDELPVNEAELAVAIANALENAIHACEALEPERRFLEIKAISQPRFMMRIVNHYDGEIEFDENDIPVNHHHDHGFGTRFIAAFCEKNNGYYQFTADGERFTLMINF
ncbi:MAG: sensor histidine kinase [Ruminococcaceae bacterium]|nr:sensor histidine kinase [Oscillospiraceae bacterium]